MSRIDYDLTKIRAIVFDVDGVLSPSTVPMSDTGIPVRMANLKDGYAMQHAVKKGLKLAIISGADVESIRGRFSIIGLKDIYLGIKQKLPVLEEWMAANGLYPEEIAYAGDDIPDLPCLQRAGLGVAPRDAAPEVKSAAGFITGASGGYGVARELIEEVMRAQGTWMSDMTAFGW
ncbi:MAG: HAD hydrolase family protein [Muribaculaceae bacterium]|nr:HAD hydrolase family protein [Muribaculaceae bacterium]